MRRFRSRTNTNSTDAIELSAEAVVARKRNKKLAVTMLACFAAFITYCAIDLAWCVEASYLSGARDTNARRASIEQLLQRSTGDRADALHAQLGALAEREHKIEEARSHYRKVLQDLEPAGQNNVLINTAHMALAQSYLDEKNWDAAAAEGTKVVAGLQQPNAERGGLRVLLGWYYPVTGGHEYQLARAHRLLASVYEAKNDFAAADKAHEQAIACSLGEKPEYWRILRESRDYVKYLLRHHRTADATRVVEQAIKRMKLITDFNEHPFAWRDIAEAYHSINDPREGEALSTLVASEEQFGYPVVDSRLALANYLSSLHQNDKADQGYRKALDASKNTGVEQDVLHASCLYSEFLLSQGRTPEAARIMRECDGDIKFIADIYPRERYRYIQCYAKVMKAAHDPNATKYDFALKSLLTEHPDAAEPNAYEGFYDNE